MTRVLHEGKRCVAWDVLRPFNFFGVKLNKLRGVLAVLHGERRVCTLDDP